MKINRLEIENVKRVKAVMIDPAQSGLTVIGGRNGQGKTSVLDALTWGLGGDKYRPTSAAREGSMVPPHIRIELSDGIVVERKGKNSALTVTDSTGQRHGQQLLNSFIGELALDLPKFLEASDREKADVLLRIIGLGDQVAALEREEKALYDKRRAYGQIADKKKKFAQEMPEYPNAPGEIVSAGDLIRQQQDILARNGENQRKRSRLAEMERRSVLLADQMADAARRLSEMRAAYEKLEEDIAIAHKDVDTLLDESTAELEASIRSIDEINRKVRANMDKAKAEEDALAYAAEYTKMSETIDEVRRQKKMMLDGAQMPLPGLSVEDGALTMNGKRWDCMSASEQLRAAAAISHALRPECGFVLLDKLEQMDPQTLSEFGLWLEEMNMQAIATRVSTGSECSIIIEDGLAQQPAVQTKAWENGKF